MKIYLLQLHVLRIGPPPFSKATYTPEEAMQVGDEHAERKLDWVWDQHTDTWEAWLPDRRDLYTVTPLEVGE